MLCVVCCFLCVCTCGVVSLCGLCVVVCGGVGVVCVYMWCCVLCGLCLRVRVVWWCVWCGGACVWCVVKLGTREKAPCVDSKRLRVYVQDASVCTGNRPACVEHAGLLPVHTETS